MHESTAAMSVPINGERIEVPGIPHLACPRCENTLTLFADVEVLHLAAFAIYRERHGLLAATEIRALRVRRRLTQARLAALLRLGTNPTSPVRRRFGLFSWGSRHQVIAAARGARGNGV